MMITRQMSKLDQFLSEFISLNWFELIWTSSQNYLTSHKSKKLLAQEQIYSIHPKINCKY